MLSCVRLCAQFNILIGQVKMLEDWYFGRASADAPLCRLLSCCPGLQDAVKEVAVQGWPHPGRTSPFRDHAHEAV